MHTGLLFAFAALVQGPADPTPVKVTFGGYADVYYAYDFGRPPVFDRAFTTQPARHNEFNANLVHVEAKVEGERIRGRFALQAGTSVQSNYAGEPAFGAVSGAALSRHIQEAVAGLRIGNGLWVDAGIYLSHIGGESWLSRDNPTYTRSLIADYSPYYQAGAKLTWTASSKVTAQLNVVNGWQIISENNDGKAVGLRFDVAFSPQATLSLYNLLGNEQPDSVPSRTRAFQGVSLKLLPSGTVTLLGTFDYGWQEGAGTADGSTWYGAALIGRVQVSPKAAIAARLERYQDPDQVIVATGSANGFQVNGGSFGVDVAPMAGLLWRSEIRGFDSKDSIYPKRGAIGGVSSGNAFVVTSFALTF